ncbi:MAG: helix-turn-helix domain-containing protein [Oscillospiraceae bacterium]|nr:helix-turn-helix domain-containing protein [Oscillospiraceae bacterium]
MNTENTCGSKEELKTQRKFRRIAYADRCKIAVWLTEGIPRRDIAARLGVTPPTVYRELLRGISGAKDGDGRLIYDPDYSEAVALSNRQLSARKPRPIIGANSYVNKKGD